MHMLAAGGAGALGSCDDSASLALGGAGCSGSQRLQLRHNAGSGSQLGTPAAAGASQQQGTDDAAVQAATGHEDVVRQLDNGIHQGAWPASGVCRAGASNGPQLGTGAALGLPAEGVQYGADDAAVQAAEDTSDEVRQRCQWRA